MILPLVWSVPEALITAELATTFPENSGYVAWVTAAFGPFWGFQVPSDSSPMARCFLDRLYRCCPKQTVHPALIIVLAIHCASIL